MSVPGPSSIHTQIETERKAALPDAALLKTFRNYARGVQRSTLSGQQNKALRGLLGNKFADNICKMVLQAPSNRLQLVRFDVPDATVLAYLADLWLRNTLPALQAATHWALLRDADHAIGLSWVPDAGVRLTREGWWNGETGMFVAYDDDDRMRYAVKDWQTPGGLRRTVYKPEQIERYIQDGAGWKAFRLASDGETWPQPWVGHDGKPLGIPVVHFPNQLVPNDGAGAAKAKDEPDSRYGMSELDGGVLGLQDEINDLHRDISAAARYTGYQMLYAGGVNPPLDEKTGKTRWYHPEPGAFFQDTGENARFGVLPAGSIDALEKALGIKLRTVSRMTDVPMHLISGDWPSGVALIRAEMGLIDKVKKLAAVVGPQWGSVAHKATRLANTFGGLALDEDAPIAAVFAAPESSDKESMADYVALIRQDISNAEALRLLGYQPDQIERIAREKAQEAPVVVPTPAIGQEGQDGGTGRADAAAAS